MAPARGAAGTAKGRRAAQATPRAWQRMLSGRRLDLLDPSPLDVEIGDIAHGLARVARWNGQTRGASIFSVAQHSVLVAELADTLAPGLGVAERMMVLLHDAPEYVIGDMISPFKVVIGESYHGVETRLLSAIHRRFSLPAMPPAGVRRLTKAADRLAAYLEATQLAGFSDEEARRLFIEPHGLSVPQQSGPLDPLGAEPAAAAFLARFEALDAMHRQA